MVVYFNDNTSNETTTMSMDHIYNNHGSMERYCGNCEQGIRKAIARENKHKNESKSIIFERCIAISIVRFRYLTMVPGRN